jgi:very-short-patch-repair endonuclease
MTAEGLPLPELQYKILSEGRPVTRVDFAWPDQKVILEMDGYKYHSGHQQWESDRNRRNELTILGWRILHGTWVEARRNPQRLLTRVATALE